MVQKKREQQSGDVKRKSDKAREKLLRQAQTLFKSRRFGEAQPLYEQLLLQMPDDLDVNYQLGQIYYGKLRFPEAIARFEHLYTLEPDNIYVRRYLFGAVRDGECQARMLELAELFLEKPLCETETVLAFLAFSTVCDWKRMAQLKDQCIESLLDGSADSSLLSGFSLDILGMNSVNADVRFALARKVGETKKDVYSHIIPKENAVHIPKGRLKIGYISGDFRNHAVGYFCYPIIGTHDQAKFEVFCYSGSVVQDGITDKFREVAEHFVDVSCESDQQIAQRIKADEVDVLVDLGGHTSSSLINVMLYRPAPVQITYLGFASTTGVEVVDYRITDHMAEGVNAADHYTEELLYLSNCFVCFGMRPSCPRSTEPPVKRNGYVTFGSFNNKRKLNPEVIALWSRVLQAVPGAKLALKTSWGESLIINVVREFMQHGISHDRVVFYKFFGSYDEHVNAYNSIDIALDPFPYTGTTTTCEALWMGVPVVTLVGESHASRVSYSILKHVGYEETIAFSEDEYVEKAVSLAMNPDGLAVLRPTLHTMFEYSPVARADVFVPELESLYLDACRRKGLDLSGLHRLDNQDVVNVTEDNPFSSLPGESFSRGLMVIKQLNDSVKMMVNDYLRSPAAPEWMVVVIVAGTEQADIASYLATIETESLRQFCVMKLDGEMKKDSYGMLLAVCNQYHRLKNSKNAAERKVCALARSRGLKVVEYDTKGSCGLMLFDRLTPDLWRMLRSYYAETGSDKPRELVIAIPWGEDRDKISGYLQNMHQFETSDDRSVQLVIGGEDESQEMFFANALRRCAMLHVPKATSTPMQKMAIKKAKNMGMKIVWHHEKPDYMPRPLPPVKNFHVTIPILTYNRIDLFKRAVASVLKQTYRDFTLVILDDASTDGTEVYCRELAKQDARIDYRRNKKNLGPGVNGRGFLDQMQTELVLGISDDDFLLDAVALGRMIETFHNHPTLGMVFGQCLIGDVHDEIANTHIPGNCTADCIIDPHQMLLDGIAGNNIFGGGYLTRLTSYNRMLEYAPKQWRKNTLEDLTREGDYFSSLLVVMSVPVAYVHVKTVYYSIAPDTIASSQLGGGWSMEIRLRTVAFLEDMYERSFGRTKSETLRIQQMVKQFRQQFQNIKQGLSEQEQITQQETLAQFVDLIDGIEKHEFPKFMEGGSLY